MRPLLATGGQHGAVDVDTMDRSRLGPGSDGVDDEGYIHALEQLEQRRPRLVDLDDLKLHAW
jgi:hypothetical protein